MATLIDVAILTQKKAELEAQRDEALRVAQAVNGALQFCAHLIAEAGAPEPAAPAVEPPPEEPPNG